MSENAVINVGNREILARLENSPLGFVEWDKDFRIVVWSKRAEEIFGYKADEVIGLRPGDWKFIHGVDQTKIDEGITLYLQNKWTSGTLQRTNITKEGRLIDCTWYNSVMSDDQGHLKSMVSLVLDETEKVQTLKELALQSSRLNFALDASGIGGWDWHLASHKFTWFGSVDRVLGIPSVELPKTLDEVFSHVHDEDLADVKTALFSAINTHGDFNHEFRVSFELSPSNPKVVERWLQVRGRIYFDHEGAAERMIGTLTEISGRKAEEQSLQSAKRSAEFSSAQKSAFLASMSHEIRTPLGVILGFADLLADPNVEMAERAEYKNIISRNGEHLSRLIDDILDLSKVEAGKFEINKREFSLHTLLTDIVKSLRSKAESKSVSLHWEFMQGFPDQVVGDPLRLKQIVMNLLANSIKFTSHGSVKLLAGADPGLPLQMRIWIEDSGVGISEKGKERLFEPFMQADIHVSRRYGGTGLGLALSRKIARLMGGDIRLIRSEPQKGSLFEFVIPLEVVEIKSSPTHKVCAAIDEDQPLKGLRLLLAEDAPDIQALMERILEKRGASLAIASNGLEACEQAMNDSFDAILMDIQMPEVDGYEATRRLRKSGYSKPIIALTAHAMLEERSMSREAGCDDHLAKPVNPTSLVRTILAHTHHV